MTPRVACRRRCVAAAGCATNPATGRRQLILMSEAEEMQIGRESDAEIRKQMGVYDDENLQRYVAGVGQKLARTSPSPEAAVDVCRGRRAGGQRLRAARRLHLPDARHPAVLRDEAELAGVLGHEIGHVDARHSAEAYSKQLTAGLGLAVAGVLAPRTRAVCRAGGRRARRALPKYGREAELESDRLGVGYAAESGWDRAACPACSSRSAASMRLAGRAAACRTGR